MKVKIYLGRWYNEKRKTSPEHPSKDEKLWWCGDTNHPFETYVKEAMELVKDYQPDEYNLIHDPVELKEAQENKVRRMYIKGLEDIKRQQLREKPIWKLSREEFGEIMERGWEITGPLIMAVLVTGLFFFTVLVIALRGV